MKILTTLLLMIIVLFTCDAQTISKNTVSVNDSKKIITISAGNIPSRANANWTSDIPIVISWDLLYTNKTYSLSKNGKVFYQSTEIDGVRSAYKAELFRNNNINQ